jgi:hypothetical protein
VLSVVPLRLRGAPPARHPAAERVHDGDLRRCLVRRFPAAEVRLRPQVLLSIPKYTGLAFYSNNASAIHIAEAYGITEATIVYLQPEVLDVACVLVLLQVLVVARLDPRLRAPFAPLSPASGREAILQRDTRMLYLLYPITKCLV